MRCSGCSGNRTCKCTALAKKQRRHPTRSRPRRARTAAADAIREAGDDYGDPGLLVRIIEGKPTITRVRPGSSAAGAGLRPGFLVTHIGGRALASLPPSGRALRPVEERFRLRQLAARRLAGPVGSRVSLRCLDENDRPIEVMLERDPPAARAIQVLNMSPVVPEVTSRQVGEVGIVAFNVFLLQPVLGEVQKAIDGFRARGAKAIIIDLRGNPGGIGAMVIPLAARLSTAAADPGHHRVSRFFQYPRHHRLAGHQTLHRPGGHPHRRG